MKGKLLGALACAMVLGFAACGNDDDNINQRNPPPTKDGGTVSTTDGGTDSGTDGGNDGGVDAGDGGGGGTTDGGDGGGGTTDGGTGDAGTGDGGTGDGGTGNDGGTVTEIDFPDSAGWTFYGSQNGGPKQVYGVSADEGGNIWVAGGEEGLFLLRKGSKQFEKFTMADGLHPYGYMADGSDAPAPHYLKVISVSGGPAGTVFVGYMGRPLTADEKSRGLLDCETNWDQRDKGLADPSIYKSGDADKVTLTGSGINVVHYDIFSGPGVVGREPEGREKVCNILRILYDKHNNKVWFGGNHGSAMGFANFQGNPTCNGKISCAGVLEHFHPIIGSSTGALLSDGYYGIALDAAGTGDVWFGGQIRSTRFKLGTLGDYFSAAENSEFDPNNKLDIWPDAVPDYPTDAQRVDDSVSGMASMSDGSVWVSSFARGLAHLDASGHVLGYVKSELMFPHVGALSKDSSGALWIGYRWGGGVSRMKSGSVSHFSTATFGEPLVYSPVLDIQRDPTTGNMLVAFEGFDKKDGTRVPGAIGVYSGN